MKSELLKLTPFYMSQFIYWFLFYIPSDQPGPWTVFVKCLPVSTLAFYIGSSGEEKNPTLKWMFLGMVFSVGGDGCLVYQDLFIIGWKMCD